MFRSQNIKFVKSQNINYPLIYQICDVMMSISA